MILYAIKISNKMLEKKKKTDRNKFETTYSFLILRYERDWRYHTDEKVWLTLIPGMDNTYYFFDPQNWRKVAKEFHLDCTKLEARPNLQTLGAQQPVQ